MTEDYGSNDLSSAERWAAAHAPDREPVLPEDVLSDEELAEWIKAREWM